MAHLLGAERVHREFPQRVVLEDVSLGIEDGDRIGVVGRNGDGKSTLLKLLTLRDTPDSGRVTTRRDLRMGVLDQTDDLVDEQTVTNAIVGDLDEHVWAGNPLVREVISGLLSDVPWSATIDTLSGGQRRRVALAALLVGDWDVVFLDEPTNHLDVEGIAWLASHLKRRWSNGQGALVVVTHDRWFLDEVCTSMWEVHDGVVEAYEGGYAAYILQRVERDRMAAASESRRQNLLRKELAWLRRGAPARTTKPKFRIEAASQLIENEPPTRDKVQLSQLAVSRLGKDVVDILGVSVAYGGVPIISDVEWRIAPGERTGILGVNGAGKSTLLGLVTGDVKPTSGRVKKGSTVRIVALTQALDELEEFTESRVSAVIADLRQGFKVGSGSNAVELSPGQLLERLGFMTSQLSTRVKELSGGQRRRLQLLLVLLQEPNVLILDEPTNDLDTDMLAAIEDLLDSWPGCLLVVSHDRYFLERVTDRQMAIIGGRLRDLPRGVEQYLELRSTELGSVQGPGVLGGGKSSFPEKESNENAGPAKPKLGGAELRNAQKDLAATERKLAKLADRIAEIHAQMAVHDHSDFAGLAQLGTELRDRESDLVTAETHWIKVSELLEGN